MPKRYATSDPHHQHKNIIDYEHRPFKDVKEMDEQIIANYNAIVNEDDITYCLGDFYFRGGKTNEHRHYWEYLKQYNGRYVIIRGNHEKSNKIIDCLQKATMYLHGMNILCVHDPINASTDYNLILCGHVHSQWKCAELHEKKKKSLIINCGVDVWDYRPVEFTKLFELYDQWKAGKVKTVLYDKKIVKKIRHDRRNR